MSLIDRLHAVHDTPFSAQQKEGRGAGGQMVQEALVLIYRLDLDCK